MVKRLSVAKERKWINAGLSEFSLIKIMNADMTGFHELERNIKNYSSLIARSLPLPVLIIVFRFYETPFALSQLPCSFLKRTICPP
jgi:hypothetical protein